MAENTAGPSGAWTMKTRLFLSLPIRSARSNSRPPLPDGIEVHPWWEDDYQPAAAVITAGYRSHVDSQVNDQYRTIPACESVNAVKTPIT